MVRKVMNIFHLVKTEVIYVISFIWVILKVASSVHFCKTLEKIGVHMRGCSVPGHWWCNPATPPRKKYQTQRYKTFVICVREFGATLSLF